MESPMQRWVEVACQRTFFAVGATVAVGVVVVVVGDVVVVDVAVVDVAVVNDVLVASVHRAATDVSGAW